MANNCLYIPYSNKGMCKDSKRVINKNLGTSMEMESQVNVKHDLGREKMRNKILRRSFLLFSCALLGVGTISGPLLLRLYFIHGGAKVWLSSWLQTAGFPIVSLSILLSYFYRRKNNPEGGLQTQLYFLTWRLFVAGAIIGLLIGVDNYLYSSGAGKLPVSTSSLLLSTQLAFTAIFAFIIVKQKFTSYSVNSVVLLIVASLILGLHASSDRPNHESNKTYYAGFFLTLGAAVLYGIILPTIELMYKKANQNVTYYFVMEMQFVISMFATAFSTVGMLVNKDFQGIPKEAREYGLGEAKYYLVLVASVVVWQCFLLGVAGVIFSASSLLSGIMIAVLLPVTEVLAVIFFHEDFKVEKGIALALSIWGFISYFYGEFKQSKKEKPALNLKHNGSTT